MTTITQRMRIIPWDPRHPPILVRDEPEPPAHLLGPSAADVAAAKQAQQAERAAAIASVRAEQVRLNQQTREALSDIRTVGQCAQLVLDAEAVLTGSVSRPMLEDVPPSERHALIHDLAIGVRLHRRVYRKLAEHAFRRAAREALKEYASHKLDAGMRATLARVLQGQALTAFLRTLDGLAPVTATEYAAATLDLLQDEEAR